MLIGCGSSGGGGGGSSGNGNVTAGGKSSDKNLTGFTFEHAVIKYTTINGTDVDITIRYDSKSLRPNVTHTGVRYSPDEDVDFAKNPQIYTITDANGDIKQYRVTVRRAIEVINEVQLKDAIDEITGDIEENKSISYITILIKNDINLTGAFKRVIPYSWAGRNIILENNYTTSNITIGGLMIEGNNTVGFINVNTAKIVSIAAGYKYSLVLDSEGKVWATGSNGGQLGLGNYNNQNSFQSVTISGLTSGVKITSIAAGSGYSFALDSNGKVWASGGNGAGQLGLGNTSSQTSFQLVTIKDLSPNATIVSISAGDFHSIILDSNGKIWASGYNYHGQLGLGNYNDQNSFQSVTIPDLSPNATIVSIAAGMYYSLALDSNGKIWATGNNGEGQLGLGNTNSQKSFQAVTIKGLSPNATIVSIAAGYEHSLALDSDGKVWATGSNNVGELGFGNPDWGVHETSFKPVTISGLLSSAKITSIAAGISHSFALDSNGKVWASGENYRGQLGLGNASNQSEFQLVTIPDLVPNAKTVSIAAGGDHSFALDGEGILWTTGLNDAGQLGLGDTTNRNVFTYVRLF